MKSEEYLLGSKGGAPMLAVKVDRCCNRYWRLFLFLGLVLLSLIVAGMLLTARKEQEMLLNSDWRDHWSENQNSDKARKTIIEQKGKNVQEKEESFDEYIDSMDDHEEDDPLKDDNEYYDEDSPDVAKGARTGQDYIHKAEYDVEAAKRDNLNPAPLGVVPDIKDYSLDDAFRTMFRQPLKDTIKFDPHYRNPCWAETIPKYPYQTNSYLTVSQQARILEPQFQQMRKVFSKRTGDNDKWRLRCLPYYYVMETPPLAVPSLYTVLGYHPFVANPRMPEPEFWNLRGPDNVATLRDYLDLFDNAAEAIRTNTTNVEKDGKMEMMHKVVTGDGTSSYLWTIDSWKSLPGNEDQDEPKVTTADLIKSVNPTAKIVIMLRNPTERLFQGYLQRTENPSASDFHDKVGQAMEAMSKCTEQRSFRSCLYDSQMNKRLKVRLRIGMYYPFIEDYINTFGKDQVKVVRYEDYITSTSQVISDVCSFLGLMPYPTKDLEKAEMQVKALEKKRHDQAKVQMLSTTRAMLKEFHKVLNEKLADILGDEKFTWPTMNLDEETLAQASNQYQKQEQERSTVAPQQSGGQSQASGDATSNRPRPKTFQEMLEKIRKRQKLALEQQQNLRRQQLERIEELRRQRAQSQGQRPRSDQPSQQQSVQQQPQQGQQPQQQQGQQQTQSPVQQGQQPQQQPGQQQTQSQGQQGQGQQPQQQQGQQQPQSPVQQGQQPQQQPGQQQPQSQGQQGQGQQQGQQQQVKAQ